MICVVTLVCAQLYYVESWHGDKVGSGPKAACDVIVK